MRALSRKKANRESLLRNLATSLVLYERIETTEAKAKEVKPVVEHLISQAKKNNLSARRQLLSYLFDENATKKILDVLVKRYKDLESGFIKSYRKGRRLGDGAMIMILELKKDESPTEETETKQEVKESAKGENGKESKVESKTSGARKASSKGSTKNTN